MITRRTMNKSAAGLILRKNHMASSEKANGTLNGYTKIIKSYTKNGTGNKLLRDHDATSRINKIPSNSVQSSEAHVNGCEPQPALPNANSSSCNKLRNRSSSVNGNAIGKQTSLKRVSFGSSKGSMVETLIYEAALDDPDNSTDLDTTSGISSVSGLSGSGAASVSSNKVRCKFYDAGKPIVAILVPKPLTNMEEQGRYEVSVKESSQLIFSEISTVQSTYARQESTDSGWENPFRPDGDLAKEADEIVGLIKEGKPIIAINQSQQFSSTDGAVVNADPIAKKDIQEQLASKTANSSDSKANGALIGDGVGAPVTGVEVEAGTVPVPADPSQVEHVVLKKKPKCKCCVIT